MLRFRYVDRYDMYRHRESRYIQNRVTYVTEETRFLQGEFASFVTCFIPSIFFARGNSRMQFCSIWYRTVQCRYGMRRNYFGSYGTYPEFKILEFKILFIKKVEKIPIKQQELLIP